MENITLQATENTPGISLDCKEHKLFFDGDSRPEDVQKFFTPIMDWLDQYANYIYFLKDKSSAPINITCGFKFEYFNSSSAKYVMDIINKLGEIGNSSDQVNLTVNWHYEEMDEDMLEAGEEFQEMVNVDFNFVKE